MGSTIVLFIEKDRMELLPELTAALSGGVEVPVKMGQWIGKKPGE
jgi:hypothetical protein